MRPPLPFDTTKALQQTSSREPVRRLIAPGRARGQGASPSRRDPPGSGPSFPPLPATPSPTNAIADSPASPATISVGKRADLTFEPPRGARSAIISVPPASECAACHQRAELAEPSTVQRQVAVFRHTPGREQVSFASLGARRSRLRTVPHDAGHPCAADSEAADLHRLS